MFSLILLSLTLSSFQLELVSAHGWLNDVVIAGTQTIVGNVPNASPTGSAIRQIDSVDPVKGANNPFLACGQNAQVASDIATANPGDEVQFTWVNGLQGPWVHNVGPMQTYMASCGSQPCNSTSFNATSASWFKIQEQGRVPGSTDNTWFMSFMNSGAPANVTIPSNIAPGNYIIRHELIALQIAQTEGGAEWYPTCAQISIGGNGTGAPLENETVTLPGAYSDTDPGILIDVYNNVTATYVFPGPAVAAFVSGNTTSTNTSSATADSDTDSTSTSSSGTTTATTSGSSGSCMKKKRQVEVADNMSARDSSRVRPRHPSPMMHRPRNLSRVMKGLVSQ